MKIRVTMKDPDTLHEAIREAVRAEVSALALDQAERDVVEDRRSSKVADICGRWFKYGEYLTVDVDTETGTCVVVETANV